MQMYGKSRGPCLLLNVQPKSSNLKVLNLRILGWKYNRRTKYWYHQVQFKLEFILSLSLSPLLSVTLPMDKRPPTLALNVEESFSSRSRLLQTFCCHKLCFFSYPANMIDRHGTLLSFVLDALRSVDDDGLERQEREGELDDESNETFRVKHELVPRRVSVSDEGVQTTNLRSWRQNSERIGQNLSESVSNRDLVVVALVSFVKAPGIELALDVVDDLVDFKKQLKCPRFWE